MQFNIAVCEDNESDSILLSEQLDEACEKLDIAANIDLFRTGEDFLSACENNKYHIAFIDIYLDGITGIEAAKRVKEPCRLVFTTASAEHAVQAFVLNADHYLLKPTTAEMVTEALKRCVDAFSVKSAQILAIKTGKKITRIPTVCSGSFSQRGLPLTIFRTNSFKLLLTLLTIVQESVWAFVLPLNYFLIFCKFCCTWVVNLSSELYSAKGGLI